MNELIYLITFNRWIQYKIIYEILETYFMGCMTDYTYGNYVYFNNNIYAPKEHNNKFIFNQEPYFIYHYYQILWRRHWNCYLSYLLIKWLKMYDQTCQSRGSVIKRVKMEETKSTNGTNVCGKNVQCKCFLIRWFIKDLQYNYVFSLIKKCLKIRYYFSSLIKFKSDWMEE